MLIASRHGRLVGRESEDAGCTARKQRPFRRIGRDLIRSQAVLTEEGHSRFGKLDRHRGERQTIADHKFMSEAEQHEHAILRDDSSLSAMKACDRLERGVIAASIRIRSHGAQAGAVRAERQPAACASLPAQDFILFMTWGNLAG